MKLTLVPPNVVDVLAQQRVGRYMVQVYKLGPDLVYRVLLDGLRVRRWTLEEERTFPKAAARAGAALCRAFIEGEVTGRKALRREAA